MPAQRTASVRWGVRLLALVALLVGCGLLASSLLGRERSAERVAGSAAASFAPPALDTPQPSLVSVISDELAGPDPGSAAASDGPPSWISIVPTKVSIRLSPFIYVGSGYTVRGFNDDLNGTTFVTRAGQISDSTVVTVFMGGAADQDQSRSAVSRAASQAFSAAQSAAPDSKIVVVGPIWPTSEVPSGVLAVRDSLRSAAGVADATWVDPISRGWLAGSTSQWNSSTNVPTAAGQRQLGTLMTRVIQQELQ